MPFNKSGLGGILRSVNDATRAVNNVTNTTRQVQNTSNSVQRMRDDSRFRKEQKHAAKEAAIEAELTWVCECKTTNMSKFCGNCGKPEPADVLCSKCGWCRPRESSAMKFCGECGTAFEG
jgi:membrane protease subunit (stomatin/prohibitin family)